MNYRILLSAIIPLLVTCFALFGCGDDGTNSPGPGNRSPAITSLAASPDTVEVGEVSTVTCAASDADGDSLSVSWYADAGSFSDSGMTASWIAPDSTTVYTIVATVTDDRGNSDVDSVQVVVVARGSIRPYIASLTADPPIVGTGEESSVVCVAMGGEDDTLGYTWEVSGGTIAGSGDSVVWTAPGIEGSYMVIVTVQAEEGSSTSDTVTIDVLNGTLLLQTNDGITAVRFDGTNFILHPTTQSLEVLGSRIFYNRWRGITELDHDGTEIGTTNISEPGISGYEFAMLPGGGFSFFTNNSDSIFIMDSTGTLLTEMSMPDTSPSSLQNVDGVLAGDRLVISETGNRQVMEIDLATHEASIFLTIDDGGGWLGAIDYNADGTFYICRSQKIHRYVEGGVVEDLCTLPDGNITGIVSVGSYIFAVINFEGHLYRINRFTGEYQLILEGLDYPQDVEYLPVGLD